MFSKSYKNLIYKNQEAIQNLALQFFKFNFFIEFLILMNERDNEVSKTDDIIEQYYYR